MAENNREITADSQVARIFEWRRGFNTIHLIDVGVHLGLFQALVERPGLTGRELAERLGLHAPYVEVWCKTAYGLEILDADDAGKYSLAAIHIASTFALCLAGGLAGLAAGRALFAQ